MKITVKTLCKPAPILAYHATQAPEPGDFIGVQPGDDRRVLCRHWSMTSERTAGCIVYVTEKPTPKRQTRTPRRPRVLVARRASMGVR